MSTNDPIEELFRENRQGLDEKPRDLLWERIEERLDEKSIQKKNIRWWKYAAAASVAAVFAIGIFTVWNTPGLPEKSASEPPIVFQKNEAISPENASEILDKLEEDKQSIALQETKQEMPEVYEEPASDIAPHPIPMMERAAEMSDLEEEKSAEEKVYNEASIVFRGDTPEKKEKNYISQKGIDERRRGNSAMAETAYSDSIFLRELQVRTKNYLIYYTLVYEDENQTIFENKSIAYPSRIIFQKSNDSIEVIYEGNDSKKQSRESKEIQKFVNGLLFHSIDIEQ